MRRYSTHLLALLCAILLSHSPAHSQNTATAIQNVAPTAEPTIEHIGQVTTPWLGHVVSTGTYAYGINTSNKIEIIDLMQPSQPQDLGATAWSAEILELSGRLLYVGSGSVLRVLDISNPTQPVEIGTYSPPLGGITGIVATDTHVYLSATDLIVLDVSNPAAPQQVGSWRPYFTVGDVAEFSHGYVYSLWGDQLYVFDVRNPAQPTPVGQEFDLQLDEVLDTAIVGNRLYAADGACTSQICGGRVKFIDVSNPAQPAIVGQYSLSARIFSIEAVGQYLYLLKDNELEQALEIVDVSAPSQPQLLDSTALQYPRSGFTIVNSYIYISTMTTLEVKRYRPVSTPFGNAPHAVPGVIQAEDFDRGGAGAAYADTDAGNRGQVYRTGEGVDLQPTTDQGGGYNVGWTAGGEWLQYTIDVSETADYTLQLRLASNGGGGDIHIEIDGAPVAKLTNLPNTGGYQAWQTRSLGTLPLTAGEHTLRLVMDRNGLNNTVANLNFLQLLPPLDQKIYIPVMTQP